jgi:ATP-dependent DNA helicase RecQ
LFWQYRDVNIHEYFIGKMSDPTERVRATQSSSDVRRFVDSCDCRQTVICRHFGESPRWDGCGICDACAETPDWLKIEAEQSKRSRIKSRAAQPKRPAPAAVSGAIAKPSVDRELNEFLREWRRNIAKENGVPAFVVLHDSALEDLCLVEPSNLQELRRVSGFGDKKVQMYGKQILEAIQDFRKGKRADASWKAKPSRPAEETVKLLAEGRTFEEIAQIRQRTLRAVVSLVADLIERGDAKFQPGWMAVERYNQIVAACQQLGMDRLKPLKEALPPEVPYEEIRLVIASLRAN